MAEGGPEVFIMDTELLSTDEVAELTGLSFRQVDYWTRRGYIEATVPAKGSGSARRYHPDVLPIIEARLEAIRRCPNCSARDDGRLALAS